MTSKLEYIPNDLKLNYNLKWNPINGLPKVRKRDTNNTNIMIKKLIQIYDFKSFNKESLQRQHYQLLKLYKYITAEELYYLDYFDPENFYKNVSFSFIGSNFKCLFIAFQDLIFKNIITTQQQIISYCSFINNIDLKNISLKRMLILSKTILNYLTNLNNFIDIHSTIDNYKKLKNIIKEITSYGINNESFKMLLCTSIRLFLESENFDKISRATIESLQFDLIMNFINSLNSNLFIKNKTIDDVLLYLIQNNKKKFCNFIFESLSRDLELQQFSLL